MTTAKKPVSPAKKPIGVHERMLEMTRVPDKVPVTPTVEYLVDQRVDERIGGLIAKLDEFIQIASHPLIAIQPDTSFQLTDDLLIQPHDRIILPGPSTSTRKPGMRVNYRSKEAITILLETGYLELVYLLDGKSVGSTIRQDAKDTEKPYSVRRLFI